jgi:ribosomal RNA-processing protein 9
MSFFVRKEKSSKKNQKVSARYYRNTIEYNHFPLQFTSVKRKISKKGNADEELDSETEEINGIHKSFPEISDEEDTETPDAKRLRLAKQYLNDIRQSDDEDEDVSKKLKSEYLESIGKLKKQLAENVTGPDSENVVTLKHKLQNQPLTCLCLAPNDNILFSGSKSGNVLKWDIAAKKQVGCIALFSNIMCIAIPSDFKFLAISDRTNKIYIYDPETLKKLHTFDGHRGVVTGMAFRKDSHQMFSCSEDRTMKVWSLDEMVYVETL